MQNKANGGSSPPLKENVRQALQSFLEDLGDQPVMDLYEFVLREVEQPLLETVMAHADANQTRAAGILGLSRGTLRKKLKTHGLL